MNVIKNSSGFPQLGQCFEKSNPQGWIYEYRVDSFIPGGIMLKPIALFQEGHTKTELLSDYTLLFVTFDDLANEYAPSRLVEIVESRPSIRSIGSALSDRLNQLFRMSLPQ